MKKRANNTTQKQKIMRIPYCICGKTGEFVSVNRAKYHKAIWRTTIGMLLFLAGMVVIGGVIKNGGSLRGFTWVEVGFFAIVVMSLVVQYINNLLQGHGLLCAARRVIINFSRFF